MANFNKLATRLAVAAFSAALGIGVSVAPAQAACGPLGLICNFGDPRPAPDDPDAIPQNHGGIDVDPAPVGVSNPGPNPGNGQNGNHDGPKPE